MHLIKVVTRKPKFANSSLADTTQLDITDARVIDHDDPQKRDWLTKHSHWAMRSRHTVTMYPAENVDG